MTSELTSVLGYQLSVKDIFFIQIVWIRDDQADIVSLDSVITVRDPRLSIISSDNNDHQERILRLANIEEHDHGLYRCVQGDITLNEILLDVLSKSTVFLSSNNVCFHMIISLF